VELALIKLMKITRSVGTMYHVHTSINQKWYILRYRNSGGLWDSGLGSVHSTLGFWLNYQFLVSFTLMHKNDNKSGPPRVQPSLWVTPWDPENYSSWYDSLSGDNLILPFVVTGRGGSIDRVMIGGLSLSGTGILLPLLHFIDTPETTKVKITRLYEKVATLL